VTIFKNPGVFDEDYLPDTIIGREREITEIKASITPLFKKVKGSNMLITGPPGVGKTLCVRHIVKEFNKTSSKVHGVYINCWANRSRSSILYEITKSMNSYIPRRGVSPDETIEELNTLCSQYWGVVIALDEIDKINDTEVLYDILRNIKTNIVVIGISNYDTFEMDERIMSTYTPAKLKFNKYTVAELKQILEARAQQAFIANSYSHDVIGLCAAIGYNKNGDARVALKVLFAAAGDAQKKEADKICVANVNSVKEKLMVKKHSSNDLKGLDKQVYDAIDGSAEAKDIYKKFSKQVSERAVRKALLRLVKKEMLGRTKLKGNVFRYTRKGEK